MLPRERVITVINHQKPDRVPVYAWLKANLTDMLNERMGSVEAFEDHYEFDLAHLFSKAEIVDVKKLRSALGETVEPPQYLDFPISDPNDSKFYERIKKELQHHKVDRGRFVYVQTPGIFESHNGVFGIENHLAYLLLYEYELHEVYKRQAEWNRTFALNCLDLGVDMIHVSDDWGSQNSLMFSPEIWWKMMYPYHKVTCDAVKERGGFLSLHSDGNVHQVLDGIIDLGYDVVHPYQESAGMDFRLFRENYMDKFTIMGGLDVQTTIGFGKMDLLEKDIRRVLSLFADGGMILCTTHFIQDHCTFEELTFAFDLIHDIICS